MNPRDKKDTTQEKNEVRTDLTQPAKNVKATLPEKVKQVITDLIASFEALNAAKNRKNEQLTKGQKQEQKNEQKGPRKNF